MKERDHHQQRSHNTIKPYSYAEAGSHHPDYYRPRNRYSEPHPRYSQPPGHINPRTNTHTFTTSTQTSTNSRTLTRTRTPTRTPTTNCHNTDTPNTATAFRQPTYNASLVSSDIATEKIGSPERNHKRTFPSLSALSVSTAPPTPHSIHDDWPVSPSANYPSPEHPPKHHHSRYSSFDFSNVFGPFPLSPTKRDFCYENEKSTFPNSAIRSPERSKRREKNVSFLDYPLEKIYCESRNPFEKIPQVTPPRDHLKMQESSHQPSERAKEEEREIVPSNHKHVISSGSNGVEVALKNESEKGGPYSRLVRSENTKKKSTSGDSNDSNNNDTPPREKAGDKGKKVTVITPQEGQNHGHSRSPSYNTIDFHNELPNVPDSPYSPFPPQQYSSYPPAHPPSFQGFPSPNKAVVKSPKRERASEDHLINGYPYPPHYGYHYPASYDDGYREISPGKRQRVSAETTESDHYAYKEGSSNYPEADHYNQDSYHRYFNRPGARDFYSESFDSESGGKHHGAAPPVSKASSYPPPSSPSRYNGPPESSANSYPGAHRQQENGGNYANGMGHHHYRGHPPPPNHPYDYYEGYYPESRTRGRHDTPNTSGPPRQPHQGYYYHDVPPPHDEVHPLLREYDQDRDRRQVLSPQDDDKRGIEKQLSPDRSTKADVESVATTPSLKSRVSKSGSPSKRKPSTAAKAAIAAGMTQPPAANEIDFDIHNPPLEPITPPSKEAVCAVTSNVNNDDVLCGRGGGTNTQIGNRKFRALVQEFQPTYLLCRRKEKPLIARTIVLIIRNRGGRFLKKDEGNGMLFEVGDEKAEAKTSQALREGLDVRASKSTTLMGRKQKRAAEKKKQKLAAESSSFSGLKTAPQTDDVPMTESPMRSQRDPPPQHEYSQYPPPPYYYGYGGQYPPYHYGYEPNPAYTSPSRKRQRSPHAETMYYPPAPYSHKGYAPYSYPPDYHYQNYPTQTQPHNETGEENAMWEAEFNPPRGASKKDDTRLKGEQ